MGSATVTFQDGMKVTANKNAFLANTEKKSGSLPCYSAIYLKVKAELGPAVCRNMFFLHAILGCDTTSRPYGTGKAASLKKYGESVYFQDQLFDIPGSTQAEVATAGENALVVLYGGKQGDFLSLDSLGYRRYYENLATRGQQRQPQNLPPTSSAARYHSLRVFLQVEQWQCLSDGM